MQPHGVITLLSLVLKINSLKVAVINRPGTLPYHLHSPSWGVVSGVGNERGLTACPQHARAHHSSTTTGLCFATCMQSWMFPLLESGWYPVYTKEWYCFNQLSKDLTSVWPQYSWGRVLWRAESDEQGSGTAQVLLPCFCQHHSSGSPPLLLPAPQSRHCCSDGPWQNQQLLTASPRLSPSGSLPYLFLFAPPSPAPMLEVARFGHSWGALTQLWIRCIL